MASWQVTGTRQDRWARANRIEVEEEKSEEEQRHYLHPDLHGQPDELNLNAIGYLEVVEEVGQEVEPPPSETRIVEVSPSREVPQEEDEGERDRG